MRRSPLALAAAITLVTPTASATYSVLLANVETGELGGAVTSCVGEFDLSAVFGYAQNEDRAVVFFTQALFSEPNHDQALSWLRAGREIREVLATLTDPTFDNYTAERQYHFLPSDAEGTTWTGASTLPYAGERSGSFGAWRYTLAGNILTSERVLTMAEASLQTLEGTIEERLLVALEAGAQHGEGDSRCSPLPGDSAYIEVRDRSGVSRLRRGVTATQPNDPLALLRQAVVPERTSDSNAPPQPPDTPPAAGCLVARIPDRFSSQAAYSTLGVSLVGLTLACLGLRRASRGGRPPQP